MSLSKTSSIWLASTMCGRRFFIRMAMAFISCGMRLHMASQALTSCSSVKAVLSSLFVISGSACCAVAEVCSDSFRRPRKVMPNSPSFSLGTGCDAVAANATAAEEGEAATNDGEAAADGETAAEGDDWGVVVRRPTAAPCWLAFGCWTLLRSFRNRDFNLLGLRPALGTSVSSGWVI